MILKSFLEFLLKNCQLSLFQSRVVFAKRLTVSRYVINQLSGNFTMSIIRANNSSKKACIRDNVRLLLKTPCTQHLGERSDQELIKCVFVRDLKRYF